MFKNNTLQGSSAMREISGFRSGIQAYTSPMILIDKIENGGIDRGKSAKITGINGYDNTRLL